VEDLPGDRQLTADEEREFDSWLAIIDEAFARAVRNALIQHRAAGNPIAAVQDGKTVLIPPEEIVVFDLD
jgi:hypothetical protein